ncbi:electron transport complex subunit RsxG [Alteromonas sp. ASW11-19]|uniref:Ion-translocating oxidoreductase complex subunit G n=1 Tax=Alteromonas salexigens TaxID=2982530 RepID=A0ABT2VP97_9ALTE|nr:electron transport complex subunit RsxG [Alteromonas salexigens]MCU7555140.1 electron transport complex subunit RsxG [Alteromonas salexigens]
MLSTLSKNGGMLAAFAVVTTALIAFTFEGTRERIAFQQQQRLLGVLNEVVPARYHDNVLFKDCATVTDPALGNTLPHLVYRARNNGEPSALAIETTAPNGYSGNIELVVGVSATMEVLGVRVVEHKETPGLGDKIELAVSDWILSFTGKQFSADSVERWQVKSDGGEFDAFTGATITPRAVVNAVKRTLVYVNENQQDLFARPNQCQPPKATGDKV